MIFKKTNLDGSYQILPLPNIDERGWFLRSFCKNEFKNINKNLSWVQLNHSFTKKKGSIRGLHYQNKPFTEIKLVKCIKGKVYDVIVDLRHNSPTYLKYYSLILSSKEKNMIYIPEGFAHGFQTLTNNCELIYHHSNFYKKEYENGIRYDDKILSINWPIEPTNISSRDLSFKKIDVNFKSIKL